MCSVPPGAGGALTLANNNAQNWNGDFTFAGTNNLNLGTGTVSGSVTVTSAVVPVGVAVVSVIVGGVPALIVID